MGISHALDSRQATLGLQIGAAVADGTAPLITTPLLRESGGQWLSIALQIVICALISIAR